MKKILSLVVCCCLLFSGVVCFAESETPSALSSSTSAVVDRAAAEIGKPYQWGAAGPDAYDASGLVSYCLTGIHAIRWTTASFLSWPQRMDPQPGDVCVSSDHCGIYIGAAHMIHAPTFGRVVEIAPVQRDMIIVKYEGNIEDDPAVDPPEETADETEAVPEVHIGESQNNPPTGSATDAGLITVATVMVTAAALFLCWLIIRKIKFN